MNSKAKGIGAGSVVRRKRDGSYECIRDEVAIEEPLEIRIGGASAVVTMRTPGNDDELAAGFLLSEGIVEQREDISNIALTVAENIVEVKLARDVSFKSEQLQRFGTISTSCGLCGKTALAAIGRKFGTLNFSGTVSFDQLLRMPEQLRAAQRNFAQTGGIHAAGIFSTDGKLCVVREDVGRHNAVDKAIGRAFLDKKLPLSSHVLLVSGRTSLEIVQKALAGGIAVVASVSAPSTLAINFAREVGQTLIGFLRPPTFNVYAHIERLALE